VNVVDSQGKPTDLRVGATASYIGADGKPVQKILTEQDITNIYHARNGLEASQKLAQASQPGGNISFNGDMNTQQYDPNKWEKVDRKNEKGEQWVEWKAKDPENPADSIQSAFEGNGKYSIDCATASNMTGLYQELKTIGPEAFNKKYQNLQMSGWTMNYDGYKPQQPTDDRYKDTNGAADKVKETDNKVPVNLVDKRGEKDKDATNFVDAKKPLGFKPGDDVAFKSMDPNSIGTAWRNENARFAGYDSDGVPLIASNPAMSGSENGLTKAQKGIIPGSNPPAEGWYISNGNDKLWLASKRGYNDEQALHEARMAA
jgi:hypothetical protein